MWPCSPSRQRPSGQIPITEVKQSEQISRVYGSQAVVQISQKLALVYTQVEAFSKVHEKINRDMAQFADSTRVLNSMVEQIEQAPYQSAPTIDKAIDYFYNTRDE